MGISFWAFMQSRKNKGKFSEPLDQADHLFTFQCSEYDRKKFREMSEANVSEQEIELFFESLAGQPSTVGRCIYYNSKKGDTAKIQVMRNEPTL
jgi:hypothetical protein